MDDTVLIGKTGIIERCCRRAREEYEKDPTTFVGDLTRKSKLREIKMPFPQGAGHGWTWGEVPLLEALQVIVPFTLSCETSQVPGGNEMLW